MDALHGRWLNRWGKCLTATTQECCEQILNKSWRQHPIKQQVYGHLPPITKTLKVKRTRYAGHCWRSRDELISDVLLWTPSYGRAKAGQPARTYVQHLCDDTGCSSEDEPEAMNYREEWWERIRSIRAGCTRWWGCHYFVLFVLMVYQISWVILCQIHPSRKKVVVLFNSLLRE